MNMRGTVRALAIGFVAIGAAFAAHAGDRSSPDFGVDDTSAYVVTAWDLQARNSGMDWAREMNGHRYITSGFGALVGGVHLPAGARITSILLEACDFSLGGSVAAELIRYDALGSDGVQVANVATDPAAAPGCSTWFMDLSGAETVDNMAYRYLVSATNDTSDGSTTIGSVRVFYKLQVSPAPGSPSFLDVPASDPAFQFIEALVSSGITAGCGNGKFCPDAPLTRRQMAVFLAKALGLHWPASDPF
jgi:hypothetical protein